MKWKRFDGVRYLSDREYQIFKAMGNGLSPLEISKLKHCQVSVKTIYALQDHLRYKLGVLDQRALTCLAARYIESGLKRIAVLPRRAPYKFRE